MSSRKIIPLRYVYIFVFLFVLATLIFEQSRKFITADNRQPTPSAFVTKSPLPSPSRYLIPIGVEQGQNGSTTKFRNSNIYFEFPADWKVYTTDSAKSDPLVALLFGVDNDDCHNYVGTFNIVATDPNNPNSFILAKKKAYGTSDQTSKIITINSLRLGLVTQPTGDGSGGYEPGITIDFLSKSKKFHYYFFAKKGCRNSFQETYEMDILPIIRTVHLLD